MTRFLPDCSTVLAHVCLFLEVSGTHDIAASQEAGGQLSKGPDVGGMKELRRWQNDANFVNNNLCERTQGIADGHHSECIWPEASCEM